MSQTVVQKFFADYSEAWRIGTADALMPFWDLDHVRFYKAEEIGHVLETKKDVIDYWRMNEGINAKANLVFTDIRSTPLDLGWESAVMRMRWDIRFTATAPEWFAGKAMGGYNHVLTLLHNGRLAGWSETPDAPILYIHRLYEEQASGV